MTKERFDNVRSEDAEKDRNKEWDELEEVEGNIAVSGEPERDI